VRKALVRIRRAIGHIVSVKIEVELKHKAGPPYPDRMDFGGDSFYPANTP
jgi:hypothetical protein